MSYSRRQFFVLGSLGLAGISKFIFPKQGQEIVQATPKNDPPSPIATPEGELLLRFVSMADTGTGAQGQYQVAQAMSQYYQKKPFPMVLMAGDNIYNNGEISKIQQVFEQPYQPLLEQGVKFHACLGNHDIRSENGDPQVKYSGFNMQGRYYTFARGGVQFFALDTNNNANWKDQLTWLESQLSQSNATWKIVFGHHQIYSSGHYGVNQPFVENLTPLFEKYGVQLYINGHDHHYERTASINGTTYLICGAGAGLREVGQSPWTEYSASRLSFAALEVYPQQIIIQGIATDSSVFDQGLVKRS